MVVRVALLLLLALGLLQAPAPLLVDAAAEGDGSDAAADSAPTVDEYLELADIAAASGGRAGAAEAIEFYNAALELEADGVDPDPSVLVKRAAAHMKLSRTFNDERATRDLDAAVILACVDASGGAAAPLRSAGLPAVCLTALTRRARLSRRLGQLDDALNDFRAAQATSEVLELGDGDSLWDDAREGKELRNLASIVAKLEASTEAFAVAKRAGGDDRAALLREAHELLLGSWRALRGLAEGSSANRGAAVKMRRQADEAETLLKEEEGDLRDDL